MISLKQVQDAMRAIFLVKDGNNTINGHIFVTEGDEFDIGSPTKPLRAVYATEFFGIGGGGGGGGGTDVLVKVDAGDSTADYLANKVVAGGIMSFTTIGAGYKQLQFSVNTGTLLLRDGTNSLTGNLSVATGITIDGVDLSAHVADPDAHHARASAGQGINVVSQQVSVNLDTHSGLTFDVTTSQKLKMGTPSALDHSTTNALSGSTHTHSIDATFNPGTTERILKTSSGGVLQLVQLKTPLIESDTDLTLSPNGELYLSPDGLNIYVTQTKVVRTNNFLHSPLAIAGYYLGPTLLAGQSNLTIGVIQADEIRVKTFVADEVRVDRGQRFDGKSFGIVTREFTTPSSIAGTVRIYFENSPSLAGPIFANNDWLLLAIIDIESGFLATRVWGQVSSYIDEGENTELNVEEQSWLFTLRAGSTNLDIRRGSTMVDVGQSGQGYVYTNVVDPTGAPYISLQKWDGANPYTPANISILAQLGNLNNVTDTVVSPTGYGLYSQNAFLTGILSAASAKTIIGNDGINIQAQNIIGGDFEEFDYNITFTTAPKTPALSNMVFQIYATKYSDAGETFLSGILRTEYGAAYGADTGSISIVVKDADDTGFSSIVLDGNDGLHTIQINVINSDGNDGYVQVGANMEIAGGVIRPTSDLGTSLGDGSHRFQYLHVDTLFVGTTSSSDTGHHHNTLYYLKSEVDTLLSAKAAVSHTHAQYALLTYVDSELAGKSDVGHTHDDRYYTETEMDALLAAKASTAHNHDSRYYTETEIDARLDALAGTALDVTESGGLRTLHVKRVAPIVIDGGDNLSLNYGVGLTVVSTQLRVDLAGISGNGIETATNKLHAKLGFGLEFDEDNAIRVIDGIGGGSTSTVVAGDGLTGGGTGETITINVGAGFGINLDTNSVIVDTVEIIDATKGLEVTGNTIGINLKAGTILSFDAGELTATITVSTLIDENFGLISSSNEIRINLASSSGLEFSTGALQINLDTNSGLILSATGIKVDPGFAIGVDGTGIYVDTATIVDTDKGLVADGVTDEIGINLAATSGLEFTSGALRIDLDANAGLEFTGNNLRVNLATESGLQLSSNELSLLVDPDGGIELLEVGIAVKLATHSGLDVSGFGLQIGTPGGLTATTTNQVSGSTHYHSVDADWNPGATTNLIKTDTDGKLQIYRMGLNKTPDALAVLTIQTHGTTTYGIKIQQTASQTAPLLAIKNSGGSDVIAFTADGSLQSMSPVFVSGLAGYKIGIDGTAEFNNIIARGEIRTAIFTRREVQVSGGSMIFATPGKVKGSFTVNASGSSTLDIYDPPNEHIRLFSVNDIIYIRALGNRNYDTNPTHNRVNPTWKFWMPSVPTEATTIVVSETWLKVTAFSDEGTFYRYTVTRQAGSAVTYPDASIAVNFGNGDRGIIQVVSDLQYAPYLELFKPSTTPWGTNGLHPILRLGRLDGVGLPELTAEQYGLVVSTDLRVQTAPRLIASNTQFKLINIDIELYNESNVKTVEITQEGIIRMGANVDTGDYNFVFNSSTGSVVMGVFEDEPLTDAYVEIGNIVDGMTEASSKLLTIAGNMDVLYDGVWMQSFEARHYNIGSYMLFGTPKEFSPGDYDFVGDTIGHYYVKHGIQIYPIITNGDADAEMAYIRNNNKKWTFGNSGLKYLTNKNALYSADVVSFEAPALENFTSNYSIKWLNQVSDVAMAGIEVYSFDEYNAKFNMMIQVNNESSIPSSEYPVSSEMNIGVVGAYDVNGNAASATMQFYTTSYLVGGVVTHDSSIRAVADIVYFASAFEIEQGMTFHEIATPALPAADTVVLYLGTDGNLRYRVSGGNSRIISYT